MIQMDQDLGRQPAYGGVVGTRSSSRRSRRLARASAIAAALALVLVSGASAAAPPACCATASRPPVELVAVDCCAPAAGDTCPECPRMASAAASASASLTSSDTARAGSSAAALSDGTPLFSRSIRSQAEKPAPFSGGPPGLRAIPPLRI